MICPICAGTGKSISERQPQGKPKERECPACRGSGEVEEVKTKRQAITIIKAHGIYSWEQEAQKVIDNNLGAWKALSEPAEIAPAESNP